MAIGWSSKVRLKVARSLQGAATARATAAAAISKAVSIAGAMTGVATGSGVVTNTSNALAGSGSVTSFELTTTAASGTYPFTVGVGFTKGDVPVSCTTDLTNYQVKIKRLWNDGSVKHAIISGRAALTQNVARTVTISRGTYSEGAALTAAAIKTAVLAAGPISVQCSGFPIVTLNTTLLDTPSRTWVAGPEMVECHYRQDVGGGTDLAVWFHVRLYADNRLWVRTVVENGYLDNGAGAVGDRTTRSYTGTAIIGGTTAYTGSITHYHATRWTAEGWIGGNPLITPKHNVDYLNQTKLVPNYWQRSPSSAMLDSLTQTYTPMGHGDIEQDQSLVGYQNQIGLLPLWDALFCTTGDSRAYKSVLANSSHINSYPISWRTKGSNGSTANAVIQPSLFPTWTVNGPLGSSEDSWAAGSLIWERAHHGSAGYLAYLLTGDYWHYETMMLQAMDLFIFSRDHSSLQDFGVTVTTQTTALTRIPPGQTRMTAWTYRTWGQACGIYPTGDTAGSELQTLLENNMAHWNSWRQQSGMNLLGYLFANEIPNATYSPTKLAVWQQHFLMSALGMASDVEALPNATNLHAVRNHLYKAIVGLVGQAPVTGSSYPFEYCGEDAVRVVENPSPLGDKNDPRNWFDNWGTVWTNTIIGLSFDSSYTNQLKNTPATASGPGAAFPGAQYGHLLPAIAYAVDHGAPGADASWGRITGASNFNVLRDSSGSPADMTGFNNIPNWGIVPRSYSTPSWLSGAAVNQWVSITGSSVQAEDVRQAYSTSSHGDIFQKVFAWNGAAIKRSGSEIFIVASGGHANYAGNEVQSLRLADPSPVWKTRYQRSAATASYPTQNPASRYYTDSKPASRHTYYLTQYADSVDRAYLMGLGSPWSPTGGVNDPVGPDSFGPSGSFAGSWAAAYYHPNHPDQNNAPGLNSPTAVDPATGLIYCMGQGSSTSVFTFNPSASGGVGSWASAAFVGFDFSGNGKVMCIDTNRNRICLFATSLTQWLTLPSGAKTNATYTGSAAAEIGDFLSGGGFTGCGIAFDPVVDCFWLYYGNTYLYKLQWTNDTTITVTRPSQTGVTPMDYRKGTTSTPSNVDSGTGAGEGIWNRFGYAPELKGLYFVQGYTQNVLFMRTA